VIKAKKSLGQNFLIDKNIINKIADVTDIENKCVLEVGPGTGSLTSALYKKKPKKIIVVEKDKRLVELLNKDFENKIDIINNDILKIDENSLNNEPLIVFGNLPYNISTEILCKWILNIQNDDPWFNSLVLMFQKEVADRIISEFNTKNYGRISILANWRLNIKKICDIKPSSFSPKPKIDSSLLFFNHKNEYFKFKDSKNLEKITRVFFMHRRKMIKKPFNQLFNGKFDLSSKLKIDLSLRPQNLNFLTYYKLTREYENLRG
jgi:16S rRNA (adenine1518-N6/adenine1519-N6)-dimethyltransferase